MHSLGINGHRKLRGGGQPANPGSPGKMAVKTECVCVCVCVCVTHSCESCVACNRKGSLRPLSAAVVSSVPDGVDKLQTDRSRLLFVKPTCGGVFCTFVRLLAEIKTVLNFRQLLVPSAHTHILHE